jgi:hypothetical protein
MKLKVGDWVEVRSAEEILFTLDKKGRLEGLPFMPQMFQYCGKRFKVFKRAHKTCDWVHSIRSRRLTSGIHLDLRCDGEAYGECQSACLIFWKEAWLKPVPNMNEFGRSAPDQKPIPQQPVNPAADARSAGAPRCTVADVWAGTRAEDPSAGDEPGYVCQGTQVHEFTTPLPWWDIQQYIEDYTSGNVALWPFIRGLLYAGYSNIMRSGIGIGAPMRWAYNLLQKLWGGIPYPGTAGKISVGEPTPTCALNLQPGEYVRVKSFKEILATIDRRAQNRGLYFDAEMVPYCGGTYRVRSRVSKYLNERTGKIATMRSDALILEGVWCRGRYSNCRLFCPRSIYPWWREIWLERVSDGSTMGANKSTGRE